MLPYYIIIIFSLCIYKLGLQQIIIMLYIYKQANLILLKYLTHAYQKDSAYSINSS